MVLNKPYSSSMDKEVQKAANIINAFFDSRVDADSAIPVDLIKGCAGLAFLTVVKAGMIWTGKLGTGVVIARLEDGTWSPPSGIGTAGIGFGAEIGGEIIDFMIVLGSSSALNTFKKGTQVSVGAGLDLAVGPVGRAAGASMNAGSGGVSGNFTYSHAKGAFAGVGLHGSTIMVRGDMNRKFYGRDVTPMEILNGHVQPPSGSCDVLYEAIRRITSGDTSSTGAYPMYGDYNRSSSSRSLNNSSHSNSRSSFSAADTASMNSRSSFEQQRTSSSAAPTTAAPIPDDPRLRRYGGYKSERELYAQFSTQKTAPSYAYDSSSSSTSGYPAANTSGGSPAANTGGGYNANTGYAAVGAETKEVYTQVINFVSTRCPYANVQVFKDNCRLFGQDAMSLDAFYSYINSICTKPLMKELVPQLVRLLPTQDKRERLWTQYCRDVLLLRV